MSLTKNQSLILLGSTAVLLAANAIGGTILLKHYDRMEEDYVGMYEVGNKLIRLAEYQEKIINERVSHIDSFDEIAYQEISRELHEAMDKHEKLSEKARKK